MKIYQKNLEKYLNKEYKGTVDDLFNEFVNNIPGDVSVFKLETFQHKTVYLVFNSKNTDYEDTSQDEWDEIYSVHLEIWITEKDKNNIYIE